MEDTAHRAIAIVGVGAVLPDAMTATAFWENVKSSRYSISEVTPDRWNPALYYDPDPAAPDKTYSKIGGWVREYDWNPMKWHLPIPPRVAASMDDAQKWAVICTRYALEDYGYPSRPLDTDRTAVILGNAMAGEMHYLTAMRLYFPEFLQELSQVSEFAALPASLQRDIASQLHSRIRTRLPEVTEDTMPGELANCMAGRIANLFNFHGPNYVADAACASAMAAISAAAEGLVENEFDVAVTGGVDRNMGASTYIKFCKIGALSGTGTRPYAEGADGFVMGEGAAIFILKRLADAEKAGDNIYAVVRGIGGASDGKGKGITAPNPVGQKLCVERAWQNAGLSPATATFVEGHGTSTRVGDVVEVNSLVEVLQPHNLPANSVALGSVKSNIGHLKGAAGAAGLLKAIYALRDKVLPPNVRCERLNPDIDFAHSPLYVNTSLQPWSRVVDGARRAGVSAFGFGGTNFHTVLEEYIPHRLTGNGRHAVSVPASLEAPAAKNAPASELKTPLRGALVIGAASKDELIRRLTAIQQKASAGTAPPIEAPAETDLRAPERIAIDFANADELSNRCSKALKALAADQPAIWKALRSQGVFRGQGPAAKVAFLYTGQGSQYLNMLQSLRAAEPIVASTFNEADRTMTPILGKPLSEYIFVDASNQAVFAKAEEDLRQTAITQPAVLTTDAALTRLLAAYGIEPDMTMGHSLGEYGALVAAGALPFEDALEAVAARGREMTRVSLADCGKMAAIFAPIEQIEAMLKTIEGYVVIANINSKSQAVIGGASRAVEQAVEMFTRAGYNAVPLEVSHAFHTSIVAPASQPMRTVLQRLRLRPPARPVVANVNGEFYPSGPGAVPEMLDILARQIASPVQFVKGLQKLYDSGVRMFVEVGPKKALQGFAEDVLGDRDVVALFTNHPKAGDAVAFNQALCGLYAAGLGRGRTTEEAKQRIVEERPVTRPASAPVEDRYSALGHLLADFLDRSWDLYKTGTPKAFNEERRPPVETVMITGAALGLPGTPRVFDDSNVARILRGEQLIGSIPTGLRSAMLDKHITRLVKSDNGGPVFEQIRDPNDVLKLAGRGGALDLQAEFGLPADRVEAFDRVTRLAIAVGLDALRDAGIPLVMRYKTTTKGTQLPDRWGLPEALRDDTGIVFASCWPGSDSMAEEISKYYEDKSRRDKLAMLEQLRTESRHDKDDLDRRIRELRAEIESTPYTFNRRFIFRTLAMGHSQFAELIGARGPNTQVNSACASTTQAMSIAQDWIREGRCRRVIVVSADDITSDNLIGWLGAGFLATGAAATDEDVREAALPFDKRRHGTILGMGAAGLVVETAEAARERGIRPICEVLSAATANSAFHGTRLDVQHICQVMEKLVAEAEVRCGIPRSEMARKMVFVSHETYTPARGGSASAEIHALRTVFGSNADQIVIANTKGFTGHAMGAGIEDVVAVKALETGYIPPVANFKEPDPELGVLNLSKGGVQPVEFALRLGAGFGSQISMTLSRRVGSGAAARPAPEALGYQTRLAEPAAWSTWLQQVANSPSAEVEVVSRTLRIRDGRSVPAPVEPPRAPAPQVAEDAVKERVLAIVAEKTGYPKEMLALDLDLEADLGIDTVKQAEVFASVREAWNIPRDETLRLRDFPTLEHVIRFVRERRPDLASATPPTAAPIPAGDDVTEQVLALVCEKTGYPKEMLALDLDLEADLGVDTVKQAELFAAVRGQYNIPRDENLKLRDFPTLAHVIRFVRERLPHTDAPAAPAPTPAADSVTDQVLELVCQKTGYPKEMLDLDLDLEADLGVDTVKQAELFAAVRGLYDIPRDENLKLRDFPTLAHVIRFVRERRPDVAPVPEPVNDVRAIVLQIVAKQTGYPEDMLDLELDLEADLGIDTVKQAEMFASIRAAFNIPRDENLRLRDFPTLAHVIRFAESRRATQVASTPVQVAFAKLAVLEKADQVLRRVPVPVLRPPLHLCKPTGVTLGAGTRVIIAADAAGVADALASRLGDRGVEVLILKPADDVHAVIAAGAVQGVFWLTALDDEGPIEEMTTDAWHSALGARLKRLYTTMRALYNYEPFLVSGVRLGGWHGYDEEGALAPLGGAVTGFTKAYKRERPSAVVKAVDFEPACTAHAMADALIAELLSDPGAVEIGYKRGQRWTVALTEQSADDGGLGMPLSSDTVFVVTGAAGSIVSAITCDLAAASGGTFYLMDLVPEPDPDNQDLARFETDREGLKRDLAARMQARGERPTPAMVEKELAALERSKAALTAIESVRVAGGTVRYFSTDLRNSDRVAAVIDEIRQASGRVDVLLHAAGLEKSRMLPDKEPAEFDLVFDVKADGWFNLLRALGDMPLGAAVAFSSISGRFGNGGQTDYSSANDLLCKLISNLRRTRPATRGIAIDWTAWAGIGMASRGSIPKMMEFAGIDMLPPEAGIPVIRRELTAGATRGEIVVANRLGALMNEWDPTGGLATTAAEAAFHGPMIGRLAQFSIQQGLRVEVELDPASQPFLNDHRIDGTAVLPGVMGIEAFAEAALCLLPGWHLVRVEHVNFLAPFKFYRDEPRLVTMNVLLRGVRDGIAAHCTLTGTRAVATSPEPQVTTHFTGIVRLAEQKVQAPLAAPLPHGESVSVADASQVYRIFFHGPAYRVLDSVWRDGEQVMGAMARDLPGNHVPDTLPLVAAPRLIELCFQTAGIAEIVATAQLGLPAHLDSVDVYRSADPDTGPFHAVVSRVADTDSWNAEVSDSAGLVCLTLRGYRTVALPGVVDTSWLQAARRAAQ